MELARALNYGPLSPLSTSLLFRPYYLIPIGPLLSQSQVYKVYIQTHIKSNFQIDLHFGCLLLEVWTMEVGEELKLVCSSITCLVILVTRTCTHHKERGYLLLHSVVFITTRTCKHNSMDCFF